ncbi:MAG: sortase domain-bontaining protein, partial [Marmoricola sp.]
TDLQPDAAAGAAPSAHVEEVPLAEVSASEVSAVVAPEAESPEAEAVVAPDDEVVAEPDHETHPAPDLDAEVAAFFGIVTPEEEKTVEADVEAPAESSVEPEAAEEPKKRWFRRKKKTAAPEALEDPSTAELAALFGLAEPEAVDGPAEAFVDDVQAVEVRADDVPVEEGPQPKRRRLRRKKATAESTSPEVSADEAADDLTPELAALFGAAEPVVDEPVADEVDNQPEDAAEAEPEAQPEAEAQSETEAQPEAQSEAEDDLHVVVVPEEDSADFVAGFLRDVSVLRHGTVPATDAPIAAADDPVEVIDPKADPEDSPPEDWVPEHRTRTRRQRKRAARANAIPVVRAPKLRRQPTRTQKVAKGLAVVGFLCVCAAAPFLVPSIPSTISDLFPDGAPTSQGIDPALDPSSGGFNGPVGIQQPGGPLAGRALASAGDPLEVQVPRLKVDSQVVPISGQTGELLPPDDPQVLGWWQEGRGVGAESGSAVVTGHTVHTGGGAFDHLGQLVAGDRIRVRTKTGWIGYVVQRSRVYSTATLARDAASIFALQGPGRLVLITCSDFNGQIYLSNSVVYAVPVLDQPFVDAPIAKPTKKPTKAPTEQPRIPYVPPSTPNLPSTPRPTHTSVPNSGPSANPTGIAGNTGPSGGVTPTEPPF